MQVHTHNGHACTLNKKDQCCQHPALSAQKVRRRARKKNYKEGKGSRGKVQEESKGGGGKRVKIERGAGSSVTGDKVLKGRRKACSDKMTQLERLGAPR
eukprot:1142421-Pelagomonas_calceolata.AAC.1